MVESLLLKFVGMVSDIAESVVVLNGKVVEREERDLVGNTTVCVSNENTELCRFLVMAL